MINCWSGIYAVSGGGYGWMVYYSLGYPVGHCPGEQEGGNMYLCRIRSNVIKLCGVGGLRELYINSSLSKVKYSYIIYFKPIVETTLKKKAFAVHADGELHGPSSILQWNHFKYDLMGVRSNNKTISQICQCWFSNFPSFSQHHANHPRTQTACIRSS